MGRQFERNSGRTNLFEVLSTVAADTDNFCTDCSYNIYEYNTYFVGRNNTISNSNLTRTTFLACIDVEANSSANNPIIIFVFFIKIIFNA